MCVDRSQAEAIVGLVQAYFPRPEFPGSTVLAWANELEPFDFDDAQEAARRLARDYRYPVLAELVGLVDEVQRERAVVYDRPALPAGDEAEALEMPQEARDAIARLREKWDRSMAGIERDVVAEDAEWQRRKAATLAMLRMHGTCLGTDKPPVEVDGVYVCPVCRVEIVDPRKAARA
jgi:hypothetical protein